MNPDEVAALLSAYAVRPWASGDFAGFGWTVGEDYAVHPDEVDIEGMKRVITEWRRALPDLTYVIHETIAQDDRVAFRWTMGGTHLAEIEGVAATGKPVTYTGISILRLRDGRVVDDRYESGSPGLAVQVGA